MAENIAAVEDPAVGESAHPWSGGLDVSSQWHAVEPEDIVLVEPRLVVEISADTTVGQSGAWRHLVRFVRVRPDLDTADVPLAE